MFFNECDREQLLRIEFGLEKVLRLEREILELLKPRLTSIKIQFLNPQGENMASITLTVGQSTVASVAGFDQNGNPYLGTIPTPSWSIDQPTFDQISADATNPANEDVLSLAAGVANLTATVGSLTGVGQITNVAQVLSSVQVDFATATNPAPAAAATKA